MTEKKQEQPKTPGSRIPVFNSVEEEAAFWDTHSSEEFSDELIPVEDVQFVRAQSAKNIPKQSGDAAKGL